LKQENTVLRKSLNEAQLNAAHQEKAHRLQQQQREEEERVHLIAVRERDQEIARVTTRLRIANGKFEAYKSHAQLLHQEHVEKTRAELEALDQRQLGLLQQIHTHTSSRQEGASSSNPNSSVLTSQLQSSHEATVSQLHRLQSALDRRLATITSSGAPRTTPLPELARAAKSPMSSLNALLDAKLAVL
jgi:type IV secretory pathway VirJ component